jgi:hypothetical protein
MTCYFKSGSDSDLVQVFFRCRKPTDFSLVESDDEEGASLMQAGKSGESSGG